MILPIAYQIILKCFILFADDTSLLSIVDNDSVSPSVLFIDDLKKLSEGS